MPIYLVEWTIDIEADSPREAAQAARQYQIKPDTTALIFSVIEHDGDPIPVVFDLWAEGDDPPAVTSRRGQAILQGDV